MDIPVVPAQYNDVLGSLSAAQQVNLSLIPDFTTKYAPLFKEYCVVGLRYEIRVLPKLGNNAGNPTGLIVFALDEANTAAPATFVAISNLPHIEAALNIVESPSYHTIDWIPQDIEDLDWLPTSTSATPVTLKLYAKPADTFTNVAIDNAQVLVTGCLRVAFRGLN